VLQILCPPFLISARVSEGASVFPGCVKTFVMDGAVDGLGLATQKQSVGEKLPEPLRASQSHGCVLPQILFLSMKVLDKHQSPGQVLLEGGFKALVRMY
jgi:hypothetical protein